MPQVCMNVKGGELRDMTSQSRAMAGGGGRIELSSLSKWYGDQQVLKSIDLTIEAGEFFSLLGPSGCGKTTTLRLIGGFERIESGGVTIDGVDIRDVAPEKRPVNTVFQSYALFPHQSVAQNVAFGLRFQNCTKAERNRRVGEALELVRLSGFESRRPHQMSGGQQQRVALARSLVLRPKVLLLDEPLGALDAKLRRVLQVELRQLHQEVGITFVYVTHDQEEALTMSDRLAVMRAGEIDQIGTPRQVYDEPATTYVADFLGIANLVPAHVVSDRSAPSRRRHGAGRHSVARRSVSGAGAPRAGAPGAGGPGCAARRRRAPGLRRVRSPTCTCGWASTCCRRWCPTTARRWWPIEGGQVDLNLAPDALRVLAN